MKNFFKLFFIICTFFITLSTNAYDNQKYVDFINAPQTQNVFSLNNWQNTHIVSENSLNSEIYLQSSNNENDSGGNLFKTSSQKKFLQEIFTKNYNKTFLNKYYKISPILKNEICTRAP